MAKTPATVKKNPKPKAAPSGWKDVLNVQGTRLDNIGKGLSEAEQRIEGIAKEVKALPKIDDVRAEIKKELGTLAKPKDGKDADPAFVRDEVTKAVAALPKPKDGRDGKDGKDAPGWKVIAALVAFVAALVLLSGVSFIKEIYREPVVVTTTAPAATSASGGSSAPQAQVPAGAGTSAPVSSSTPPSTPQAQQTPAPVSAPAATPAAEKEDPVVKKISELQTQMKGYAEGQQAQIDGVRNDLDAHKQEVRAGQEKAQAELDELSKGVKALQEKSDQQAGEIVGLKNQHSQTAAVVDVLKQRPDTTKVEVEVKQEQRQERAPEKPAPAEDTAQQLRAARTQLARTERLVLNAVTDVKSEVKGVKEDVKRLEQKHEELDKRLQLFEDIERQLRAHGYRCSRCPPDPKDARERVVKHYGTIHHDVTVTYVAGGKEPEAKVEVKPKPKPDLKAPSCINLCPPVYRRGR